MAESSFRFTQPLLIRSDFKMLGITDIEKIKAFNPVIHLHRRIARHESKPSALVELRITLNKDGENVIEGAPFTIEVEMQSSFEWPNDMENEFVENLLKYNATALLLSYARPIIATITSASPLPTYNIPFLDLQKLFRDNE